MYGKPEINIQVNLLKVLETKLLNLIVVLTSLVGANFF